MFPLQVRIVGGVVFYGVRVLSKESRRLVRTEILVNYKVSIEEHNTNIYILSIKPTKNKGVSYNKMLEVARNFSCLGSGMDNENENIVNAKIL
jgi:hypothetical protein